MLELKKGVDILAEVGGVRTLDEAQTLFAHKLDPENLAKLSTIHNVEQIDRGYQRMDKRLNALGAKIRRVTKA